MTVKPGVVLQDYCKHGFPDFGKDCPYCNKKPKLRIVK